jgi:hypothetical protein
MRDIVFLVLVAGFFGAAALFVRACDAIAGPPSDDTQ